MRTQKRDKFLTGKAKTSRYRLVCCVCVCVCVCVWAYSFIFIHCYWFLFTFYWLSIMFFAFRNLYSIVFNNLFVYFRYFVLTENCRESLLFTTSVIISAVSITYITLKYTFSGAQNHAKQGKNNYNRIHKTWKFDPLLRLRGKTRQNICAPEGLNGIPGHCAKTQMSLP